MPRGAVLTVPVTGQMGETSLDLSTSAAVSRVERGGQEHKSWLMSGLSCLSGFI